MSEAKTVAKNTLTLGVAHIASKFIYLILLINITRFLGDAGFGRFSFAYAFANLFMYVCDMGLSALATRDVARKHSLASKYLGASMILKAFSSLITLGLIYLATQIVGKSPEVTISIWIFGIALVLQTYQVVFLSIFRAFQKMEYDGLAIILHNIVVVILGMLTLFSGGRIIELAWAFVITTVIVNIILLIIILKKFVKPKFKWDPQFWMKMITESWPFMVSGTFGIIYYQIGVVLIGLFWPDRVVGWYSAGMQLVNALLFLPNVFNISMFPLISQYYTKSHDSLKYAAHESIKLIGSVALPIAVGTTILATKIFELFYPHEFLPGVPAMQILIWALCFTFLRSMLTNLLNAANRQTASMQVISLSTLLMLVLSLLLIPLYSFMGAAYAILISETFSFTLYWVLTRRGLFKIPVFRLIWRPAIASIIMGFIVWSLKDLSILISIPVSGLSYLALLYVFGVLKEEIKMIKASLQ